MSEGRRLRRVGIHTDLLVKQITTGWTCGRDSIVTCVDGLPQDAKWMREGYDPLTGTWQVIFEHESFEPVPPNEIIPYKHIAYREDYPPRFFIKYICKGWDSPAKRYILGLTSFLADLRGMNKKDNVMVLDFGIDEKYDSTTT